MHQYGHGVNKNIDQAIKWYTKSANQGAIPVQYMLGLMYYHGKDVKKDISKAKYWLSKAANQGMIEAKAELEKIKDK